MTAQPDIPSPDTGSYQVIHLGGQAAVMVPVTDTAAVLEWKARDAAGQTTFVSAGEARRRLGTPR